MKPTSPTVLGIDIGSVSVGVVQMTPARRVVNTGYEFHYGDTTGTLVNILAGFDLPPSLWAAASAATPETVRATQRFDEQICCIAAARHYRPETRAILNVGGEKFQLIRLGADGGYLGSRGSTSCAAGTGAFLDQQARRLNLAGAAAIARQAVRNRAPRPRIASRCAVFAKTDLIHAQQEGHGLEAICDGLCHGLAKNIADTVAGGATPPQPLLFCGGVALNPAVHRYLEQLAGTSIRVVGEPQLYGALGAALRFIETRLEAPADHPPPPDLRQRGALCLPRGNGAR